MSIAINESTHSGLTVDAEEYARRVDSILPALRERAVAAENMRRLPQETFDELKSLGIFKVFQPKRLGGFELPPMVFFDSLMKLAEACPATGWVYGVIGPHGWEIAAMHDEVQRDVWGENPDAIISSSYAPMGKVEEVDGGFRLNGRWRWSSGSDGAEWCLLGGLLFQEDGIPQQHAFLLPRKDYEIEDTWHAMGLCGTGSNDIVVKDAFVPQERSHNMVDAYYFRNPGREVNPGPLYTLPFFALFAPLLSYAAFGMAKGAYKCYLDQTIAATKRPGPNWAESQATHLRVAHAISNIESSYHMLTHLIEEMTAYSNRGEEAPLKLRKRIRFEAANGVARATEAVRLLYEASGSTVADDGHPIQKYFRDIHTARVHVANNVENMASMFAREELGVAGEPKLPPDFLA